MKDKDFEKVIELLQTKFGWDWTVVPNEKLITGELINDTIKAVKRLQQIQPSSRQKVRKGFFWSEKMLMADAKKYKLRSDWQNNSGSAYIAAYRRGGDFYEKCCKHMHKYNKNWTDAKLLAQARKYKLLSTWEAKSSSSFKAALSKGKAFFKKCTRHMKKQKDWTNEEAIKSDAKKYIRRSDWCKKSLSAYRASLKKGKVFHNEVCKHMNPLSRNYFKQ